VRIEMTKSQAYKIAPILDILSDPQALLIASKLEDKSDKMNVEEIADHAQCSDREAKTHLEDLENKRILQHTSTDGTDYYEFTSSENARILRRILDKFN
jgi:predicted ArsR family transcriptional regulator